MLTSTKFSSSEKQTTHPKYRADIDGLRAIAVLSVVGFHAFPTKLPGGYVGVDIFFIISGFLISSIIFSNLERGSFGFVEFYSRRIKRIFPALLLVLIACYAFGWFSLLADEYAQLGKHIAGGAGFVSNFVLWGESGYFDNSSETKPLLHLWSLGIEEQFYIIWPLLLWLVWKLKLNFLTVTMVVALISFALNIASVNSDAVATFYSPLTRFWELLIGSMLAYLNIHKLNSSPTLTYKFYNTLSTLGVLLIAFSIFLLNKEHAFPGWWALLPTIGAVFIVSAGAHAWLNRTVLSNRVLVWFGLISFPLYLWHWPLLTFARIVESNASSLGVRIAAVLASIVLAWLTYKLIEKPIRFGNYGKTKTIMLVLIMIVVGVTGYQTYKANGYIFRESKDSFIPIALNSKQLQWTHYALHECTARLGTDARFCFIFGNPQNIKVAVIGDSTGNALSPGLANIYATSETGLINIGHATCPPFRGLVATATWGNESKLNCPEIIDKSYDFILKSNTIKTVFLTIFARDLKHWGVAGLPLNATLSEKFEKIKLYLNRDIAELNSKGMSVIVTYDAPLSPVESRDCIPARPLSYNTKPTCEIDESQLIDRQPYLSYFDDFFRGRNDVCIFRQSDLLISSGKLNIFDVSGNLLIRDTHHLSYFGSNEMANIFKKSRCFRN